MTMNTTVGIGITHNVRRTEIPCSMKFMRFELPRMGTLGGEKLDAL